MQGKALTDDQIETIRAAWLLTENGSEASRQAGCSTTAANTYIRHHRAELLQLRQQKRPELKDKLGNLIDRLLSVAVDPRKLDEAPLGQVMTGIGIAIDKYQLVTGEATERHEHRNADEAREQFARRLDELAERRRTRAAVDGARAG